LSAGRRGRHVRRPVHRSRASVRGDGPHRHARGGRPDSFSTVTSSSSLRGTAARGMPRDAGPTCASRPEPCARDHGPLMTDGRFSGGSVGCHRKRLPRRSRRADRADPRRRHDHRRTLKRRPARLPRARRRDDARAARTRRNDAVAGPTRASSRRTVVTTECARIAPRELSLARRGGNETMDYDRIGRAPCGDPRGGDRARTPRRAAPTVEIAKGHAPARGSSNVDSLRGASAAPDRGTVVHARAPARKLILVGTSPAVRWSRLTWDERARARRREAEGIR